jgi:hypothetical protein
VPKPKTKATTAQTTPPPSSTQARRETALVESRLRAVKAALQNIAALIKKRTVKIASAGYETGTLCKMKTTIPPNMRVATADRIEAKKHSNLLGERLKSSIHEA